MQNSKIAQINVNAIKINFRKSCFIRGSSIKYKNKQTSNLYIQLYMFPKCNSSTFRNWSILVIITTFDQCWKFADSWGCLNDVVSIEIIVTKVIQGRQRTVRVYFELFVVSSTYDALIPPWNSRLECQFLAFQLGRGFSSRLNIFCWMSKRLHEQTRPHTWLCPN